ncbi:hypothetical protein [Mycobacterium intracellulare]|uniref:hypothetical protein n=1 Tax=Mycobacterium intracellulare TaxID=1767 RepID=UPI001EED9426|nr:hypothetical protein [Mycobacterium intracellulare]MEE3755249.1 hypothetical protein [Mycobacterium intracellulare]
MNMHSPVQAGVLDVLACGRAMTVVELQVRLAATGLGRLHAEPIYQGLGALERRGMVAKVRLPGQSRTHWAVADSAALHLRSAAYRGAEEAHAR